MPIYTNHPTDPITARTHPRTQSTNKTNARSYLDGEGVDVVLPLVRPGGVLHRDRLPRLGVVEGRGDAHLFALLTLLSVWVGFD